APGERGAVPRRVGWRSKGDSNVNEVLLTLIQWMIRFSVLCIENYPTVVIATAFVALIMAGVLFLVRKEVLSEEAWILYLAGAFFAFFIQYGLRAVAAFVRGGNWS